MKKYLLTAIGELKSEKMCKDLAVALTPIVDSQHLKFQHTKGVLIFHFASEVSKEELYDYIYGIFYGLIDAFILTDLQDNLTVSMPKDIKEHLLDLENDSENVEMRIDMNRIKNNLDLLEDESEEDFVALMLGEKFNFIKEPSLDQILDKILEKGPESLTQFEKDTLEKYSKK